MTMSEYRRDDGEATEADLVDQHRPAVDADEPADPLVVLSERGIPAETSEGDVLEQAEEVPEFSDENDV
ncbi:MAG: hypothetical protein ACQSGP_26225 [Frankia sp.]